MKLKLHHINLCTSNVKDMDKFYREVLCLGDDEPSKLPPINQNRGLVGDVSFVTDGDVRTSPSVTNETSPTNPRF